MSKLCLDTSAYSPLFWVNDADCLTEVDIDFTGGDCSIEFRAAGGLDSQGRYSIDHVTIDARGNCPTYHALFGQDLHLEDGSFGTIEVIRSDVTWDACEEGELILRADAVVTDIRGQPVVEFSGAEIRLQGGFQATHYDPLSGCPSAPF